MATNLNYKTEEEYLPQNIRQFIAQPNKVMVQSYDMFFTLFNEGVRHPLMNNWMAAKFAAGWTVLNKATITSGIAPRLLKIKTAKTCGKVFYQSPKESEKDVNEKLPKEYLSKKLYEAFDKCSRSGRALMVLYKGAEENSKAFLEVFDAFRHDLVFDEAKEIIEAKMFINKLDGVNANTNYFIVEHRYYNSNNQPCQKIKVVFQMYANESKSVVERTSELENNDIPEDIQKQFKGIKFNKESVLEGFTDLGVYHIDETAVNSKYPDSNIPEAMFVDAVDEIVMIENSMTAKEIEKQIGRGQVLVPTFGKDYVAPVSTMGINTANTANVVHPSVIFGAPTQKNPIIHQYPTKSMEDSKPTSVQFDFRPDQWEMAINSDVGRLCALVGISILDYDPRLLQVGQRNETELNAMTDITALTVQTARNLNEYEINKMLACLSSIYGLPTPVTIRWSMASLMNPVQNTLLVTQQLTAGVISRKEAMRRLNPDLNETELEDLYKEVVGEIQAASKDVVIDEFSNF